MRGALKKREEKIHPARWVANARVKRRWPQGQWLSSLYLLLMSEPVVSRAPKLAAVSQVSVIESSQPNVYPDCLALTSWFNSLAGMNSHREWIQNVYRWAEQGSLFFLYGNHIRQMTLSPPNNLSFLPLCSICGSQQLSYSMGLKTKQVHLCQIRTAVTPRDSY